MNDNRKKKDQEMAHRMKLMGEERRSGKCPICQGLIPMARIYIHITAQCAGPAKRKGSNGPVSQSFIKNKAALLKVAA